VLSAVERVAGQGFDVRQAPRRAGDPASIVSNPVLIKKTLGWVPTYDDLDQIVAHALAWEKRLAERNR
jgi:UDP-glucose 4-epimerase